MNRKEELESSIQNKIKNKQPYSQREVAQLSTVCFEMAYNGEKTIESLAYQRGLHNGMCRILQLLEEVNTAAIPKESEYPLPIHFTVVKDKLQSLSPLEAEAIKELFRMTHVAGHANQGSDFDEWFIFLFPKL